VVRGRRALGASIIPLYTKTSNTNKTLGFARVPCEWQLMWVHPNLHNGHPAYCPRETRAKVFLTDTQTFIYTSPTESSMLYGSLGVELTIVSFGFLHHPSMLDLDLACALNHLFGRIKLRASPQVLQGPWPFRRASTPDFTTVDRETAGLVKVIDR
jgi:hypothetical protein